MAHAFDYSPDLMSGIAKGKIISKKPPTCLVLTEVCFGGLEGIRTLDLLFRRQTLYPLSYEPDSHFPVDNRDHTRTLCAFSHPCAS